MAGTDVAAALASALAECLAIVEAEYAEDPEPEDLPSWRRAIDGAHRALRRFEGRSATDHGDAHRTWGLLAEPIVDADGAREVVREIVARGLAWHLEEDPATVIDATTGARVFTDAEADDLRARATELYALDAATWGDHGCPIGYMTAVEEGLVAEGD
jgi:hypothetical protein